MSDPQRLAVLEPCEVCGAPARHACSTGRASRPGGFPVFEIVWRCEAHAPPPKPTS